MSEPVWTTSCPDWETKIVNRQSLVPFAPLFPEEARACMQVMGDLRIVDAPGSPLISQSCAPWIDDLGNAIFGAYNADTGERLIKEFFLLISKKNAKSTIAAAIMLTVLIRNWRQSAEFIILAPTIEVANNAYAPARDMIKHDEELSALLHVQDHVRTITHRESGATLKVVAADQNTVGGKKAAVVLVDELHLFGKNPHAANMLREATGGLASRPEGFVIYLTTQSDQPPAGVFREKLMYARGVRDGTIVDPNFLPIIYEFPKRMLDAETHRLPENFYVTNPNMGYSVSEKFLIREMGKAEEAGEAEVLGFMSKHLNVEIGLALRSDRWAGADFWAAAAIPVLTLDKLIEMSEVIAVGIDGGGLDDLLGFAAVGRDKRTRDWLVWTHAWAHPSVLERRKAEAPRFKDFEKDGNLTLSERIGDDVADVADLVEQVEASGLLDKVGCDPVGIGAIYDAMIEREIPRKRSLLSAKAGNSAGRLRPQNGNWPRAV